MINDSDLKNTTKEVVKMYKDIELNMLNKLAKFLDVNDEIGGSAKWHIEKLNQLSILNRDLVDIVSKYTTKSEEEVRKMFELAALSNFTESSSTLLENEIVQKQIDDFTNNLNRNLAKIRTNIINETKAEYLKAVDKATLEVSSGIKSFSQSVTDSLSKLGEKGITSQLYQRENGKIVKYNVEGLVRRDALNGVFAIANNSFMKYAEDRGMELVYVSQHLGARTSTKSKIANHAGWQGKIYTLNGKNDQYKNFYEETGYGTIDGLGGVNCRHRVSAAYDGMEIPERISEKESRKQELLDKKQRYLERGLQAWKRKAMLFKYSGNKSEYKKSNQKLKEWNARLQEFTNQNNLRRDYSRERVVEQ